MSQRPHAIVKHASQVFAVETLDQPGHAGLRALGSAHFVANAARTT